MFLWKISPQKLDCEKKMTQSDDELVLMFLNEKRKKEILDLRAAAGTMSGLHPGVKALAHVSGCQGGV